MAFEARFRSGARLMCPICGHMNYCGRADSELSGLYVWCCKRNKDLLKGDTMVGSDGTEYICASVNASDNRICEPKELYVYRRPKARVSGYVPQTARPVNPIQHEERIEPFPDCQLDTMWRYFLTCCGLFLEREHREYLHSSGVTDEMINHYHIVSYPEADKERRNGYSSNLPKRWEIAKAMEERFGDLSRLPNAYWNDRGYWSFGGPGGILFPVPDYKGQYVNLRTRVNHRWSDAQGNHITEAQFKKRKEECRLAKIAADVFENGKYVNFASSRRGASVGNRLGIYSPIGVEANSGMCFITEGEKKAMITAQLQESVVVSVPGVSSWSLLFTKGQNEMTTVDWLKESGMKVFVVAYDADKEHNKAVLDAERGLVDKLKANGFSVAIAYWDESVGKGIDDALLEDPWSVNIEIIY